MARQPINSTKSAILIFVVKKNKNWHQLDKFQQF
jgi:hypothetical protein